ncbi:AGAP013208-PA, partial [Anopheles gambiae str. PEST]
DTTPYPPTGLIIEYITYSPAFVEYGANGETYINYPQLTAYSKSSSSSSSSASSSSSSSANSHGSSAASSAASPPSTVALLGGRWTAGTLGGTLRPLALGLEDRFMSILIVTALSCVSFFRYFQIYLPWITLFLLLLLIGRKPKEKISPDLVFRHAPPCAL